jgi:hypothetical protein
MNEFGMQQNGKANTYMVQAVAVKVLSDGELSAVAQSC